MRPYFCLLLLAACAGSSQATMPGVMTNATCPAPPETICPEPIRPDKNTCPVNSVGAPSAATPDWHCMELYRPREDKLGFCWSDASVCETKRKQVVSENLGTSSLCTTQRVAYCIGISFPLSNTWKAYCARTPEGCQEFHDIVLKEPPDGLHEIGTCRPAQNINPLESMEPRVSTRGL